MSAVFINVVDVCVPSDMSAGSPEEIDEERRLLYVAMTRAKRYLYAETTKTELGLQQPTPATAAAQIDPI